MKYISGLYVDEVPVPSLYFSKASNVSVAMIDTDTGVETLSNRVETYQCLGVQCLPTGKIVVKHSRQAVQLFDHMDYIAYSPEVGELYSVADKYYITRKYEIPYSPEPHIWPLQLDCRDMYVVVNGWGKSVVEVRDGGGKSYTTLYDFLVKVCRHTGLNIMSWNKAVLFSHTTGFSLEMGFKHGGDHEKFFRKMLLMG